jgi:hypothetical protein
MVAIACRGHVQMLSSYWTSDNSVCFLLSTSCQKLRVQGHNLPLLPKLTVYAELFIILESIIRGVKHGNSR